jgi:hypothetical protein
MRRLLALSLLFAAACAAAPEARPMTARRPEPPLAITAAPAEPTADEPPAPTPWGAPNGGAARDATSVFGALGTALAASGDELVLAVRMDLVRAHPLGPRLQPVLAASPKWKPVVTGTKLDPYRDLEWLFVVAEEPSLADLRKVTAVVRHAAPERDVDAALKRLSATLPAAPRGLALPAASIEKDAVALRAGPGLVVVTGAARAKDIARAIKTSVLPERPAIPEGEAVTTLVRHPHRALPQIPESVEDLRVWIVPRSDGGADLWGEGQCATEEQAKAAAEEMNKAAVRTNGLLLRAATKGLLNAFETRSEGRKVLVHLPARRDQLEAVITLVETRLAEK